MGIEVKIVNGQPRVEFPVPCLFDTERTIKAHAAMTNADWLGLKSELNDPLLLFYGLRDFKLSPEQLTDHIGTFALMDEDLKTSLYALILMDLGKSSAEPEGRAKEYLHILNSQAGFKDELERLLSRAEICAEESLQDPSMAQKKGRV